MWSQERSGKTWVKNVSSLPLPSLFMWTPLGQPGRAFLTQARVSPEGQEHAQAAGLGSWCRRSSLLTSTPSITGNKCFSPIWDLLGIRAQFRVRTSNHEDALKPVFPHRPCCNRGSETSLEIQKCLGLSALCWRKKQSLFCSGFAGFSWGSGYQKDYLLSKCPFPKANLSLGTEDERKVSSAPVSVMLGW